MKNEIVTRYIEISAKIPYWDDATVNGVTDDGNLIPLRNGDLWNPIIDLTSGMILEWLHDTKASLCYKISDEGEYYLLDATKQRIAKYRSSYVPDCLCTSGYACGKYIIMDIDGEGRIDQWKNPAILPERWGLLLPSP